MSLDMVEYMSPSGNKSALENGGYDPNGLANIGNYKVITKIISNRNIVNTIV